MNDHLKQQLNLALQNATLADLAWAMGYMQGRYDALSPALGLSTLSSAPTSFTGTLGIYYASETGNSKKCGIALEKAAKEKNIKVKNQAFSKIKAADLKNLSHVVFILSTHGEGEYPDSAKTGVQILEGLDSLSPLYAIVGLGDSSYQYFCGAAESLDKLFISKNASCFYEKQFLDVDYDQHLTRVFNHILGALTPCVGTTMTAEVPAITGRKTSRLNPVRATLLESINLNDTCSDKETYHLELEFSEEIAYTVGDALGIVLPESFKKSPEEALPPRLYSIASSQKSVDNNVHLTVALAKHILPDGTWGYGICSHYLSSLKAGDIVECYIHANQMFRLPADESAPIIMVGPGTGIAPFRAFMQERDATGATGKNWLFFGDRTSHADFLYQAEWQDYVASGILTRIDLAFSRDDAHKKIYVQDKMREQGRDLIDWLDTKKAYFYICGTKDPMAMDVEKCLLSLAVTYKNISEEQAILWLEDLKEQGRYLKDVY